MPLVEKRSSLHLPNFPIFGTVYLILLSLKYFAEAGIRATKPLLMTNELRFTEDMTVITIHAQIAGGHIIMFISNILIDIYSSAYGAFLAQEFIKISLTYPVCVLGILGYLPLETRKLIYLSGQGLSLLSSVGSGGLNALVAEQFTPNNYRKFLNIRMYISMLFTFLGVVTLPQLAVAFKCFETESCYIIVWIMDWVVSFIIVFLFLFLARTLNKPATRESGMTISMRLARDGRRERKISRASGTTRHLSTRKMSLMEGSSLYNESIRKDAAVVWPTWKFFLPLSIYWALQSQYTTTWIFQATHLLTSNVKIDDFKLTILPNQIWGVVPLFGLAFFPIMSAWLKDTDRPLRVITASQLAMAIAFFLASFLQYYILSAQVHQSSSSDNNHFSQLSWVWALPQHLIVSISDIIFVLSYRMFTFHSIPKSMQQVTRNMFIVSKFVGNFLVVLVILSFHYFGFPPWEIQYSGYSIFLCSLIIVFTLLNNNFDHI